MNQYDLMKELELNVDIHSTYSNMNQVEHDYLNELVTNILLYKNISYTNRIFYIELRSYE